MDTRKMVSQRFIECVEWLKDSQVIDSYKEFSDKIGITAQSFNDIKALRRYVTIEMIVDTYNTYNINPRHILLGEQPMIEENSNGNIKSETGTSTLVVTVDSMGNNNIVQLDAQAAAGMPANYDNPSFFGQLPAFSLPGSQFQNGTFICVQVTGDSMHPTIYHHDWLIAEYQDDWNTIREGYVHVIVTVDGVLAKRVLNRISKRGAIVLQSDNEAYPTYEEKIENVLQIWRVKGKLSFNLRNENLDVRKDLNWLKTKVVEIERKLR